MDKPHSFSPLEIAKMLKQLEDALTKIGKVCDNLEKAGDVKNAVLLVQAAQNIMRVYERLEGKPRKSRKWLIEKAKKVLAQKTGEGPKFQLLESREKFCGDKTSENLHLHPKRD